MVRGVELPLSTSAITAGTVGLPAGARLELHRFADPALPSLSFVPIVNKTSGSGVVLAVGMAVEATIQGNNSFHYLEGCWHLITPYARLEAEGGFPGLVLSTGAEDYFDSSFYFHAGIFQLDAVGVTKMCAAANDDTGPHPTCIDATHSRWSAYQTNPLFFEDGVQLIARNGDVAAKGPLGPSQKCYNMDTTGGEAGYPSSAYQTLAWVYVW